jgi:AcrR family transcriptional regulator
MSEERLSREDWIQAALGLLAEGNVDSVLIPPLAKRLGVTKGSFYWHFKNREDMLDAVLEEWHRRATARVIEKVERAASTPVARLRALFDISNRAGVDDLGGALELAVRNWARLDKRARAAVAAVDAERLSYLAQLYRALGMDAAPARHRAFAQYAFSTGARVLFGVPEGPARDQIRDASFRLLTEFDGKPAAEVRPAPKRARSA